MKKKLNILCLLILLVLGYSVSDSMYQFGLGVWTGFQSAVENAKVAQRDGKTSRSGKTKEMESFLNMKPVALLPAEFPTCLDSVLNAQTGKFIPMVHSQMLISLDSKTGAGEMVAIIFSEFVALFAGLAATVIFIFIIVYINKSEIFTWGNVSRLQWLGWLLIVTFLGTVIPIIITSIAVSGEFALAGYRIYLSSLVSITNLVLGLSAFVVAEAFAIALRMKEEQDLTI